MFKYFNVIIFFSIMLNGLSAQQTIDTLVCDKGTCCCSDDPTPAGVMISHVHRKKEWMFSYRYMNMAMSGLYSGTHTINQTDVFRNYLMVPTNMQMNMHMLMAMYGVTDKITVMAMLNYNAASMSMKMYAPTNNYTSIAAFETPYVMNHSMTTSGIGDIKLHILYSIINTSNHHLLANLGAGIPSGKINFKGSGHSMMYPDSRYPYAMQPGSGTWDALPCVSYLFQKNKFTCSAQVSSVIRTGYNYIGYRLGNEAVFTTWLSYKWCRFLSSSLRVEGIISGKISGNDPTLNYYYEPSANPANYGGKKMNCYIGSMFQGKKRFLKNYRLGVEYGLPVYQNLNGIQMAAQRSFFISLSRLF